MEEIKEDLYKWRDITYSLIGRLKIVKMAILSRLIYRFITIIIKIPTSFSAETDELVLKFTGKYKRPKVDKTTLIKKSKVEGISELITKLVTNTMRAWNSDRCID
ncbi:LORF2 protein, partial [Crocuta crocuta]